MAVIITNMDMPRGCFECPLREEHGLEGDWCAVSEGCDLIGETTRPDYCPLKSAENVVIIPDNATNGDIIQALYPDMAYKLHTVYYENYFGDIKIKESFWKEPYKIDAINQLPSVTPQEPKWILDSERLPEKTGRYLITYCYRDKIETQEAVYVEDEEEIKWYDTTGIEITLAVIAWMPLPEPYSEVEE